MKRSRRAPRWQLALSPGIAAMLLAVSPACYDTSVRRVVVVSPTTHLDCLARATRVLGQADYWEVRDFGLPAEKGVSKAFYVNRSGGVAAGWGIEVTTVSRNGKCEYMLFGLTGDWCAPPRCDWSEARRPDLDAKLVGLERALGIALPEDGHSAGSGSSQANH